MAGIPIGGFSSQSHRTKISFLAIGTQAKCVPSISPWAFRSTFPTERVGVWKSRAPSRRKRFVVVQGISKSRSDYINATCTSRSHLRDDRLPRRSPFHKRTSANRIFQVIGQLQSPQRISDGPR